MSSPAYTVGFLSARFSYSREISDANLKWVGLRTTKKAIILPRIYCKSILRPRSSQRFQFRRKYTKGFSRHAEVIIVFLGFLWSYCALNGNELPEGFDHILTTAESGEWWAGECGGIRLSEIPIELAAKIAAKNKLLPTSCESAHTRTGVAAALQRVTVSRNVPIPCGIEERKFSFVFDRVFWFACLENSAEVQRAEPAALSTCGKRRKRLHVLYRK